VRLTGGDVVQTRYGTFTIAEGGGHTIAPPISNGSNAQLSDQQVAAVVFNETRSLSGDQVGRARQMVAHAVINGDEKLGARRPLTAGTSARVPDVEARTMRQSGSAVAAARAQRELGFDPTNGSIHFNLRPNAANGPFNGHDLTTQSGPLNNSFPVDLPATGVYVNTYE
jgi:hypothetical protein